MNYGVKVQVGNFCMQKKQVHLSKKEIRQYYCELPESPGLRDAQKDMQRAGLPYIEVSTISGSWKVMFAVSETMFHALDALTVVKENGRYMVGGPESGNIEALFVLMYANCSIVGDAEYQKAKAESFDAYIKRMTAKEMDGEKAKEEDKLRKENEDAVNDVMERDKLLKSAEMFGEGLHAE